MSFKNFINNVSWHVKHFVKKLNPYHSKNNGCNTFVIRLIDRKPLGSDSLKLPTYAGLNIHTEVVFGRQKGLGNEWMFCCL